MDFTEQNIINCLKRHIDVERFPFQFSNVFIYRGWECDYFTITAGGETREYEIKISRGDFFSDAKKGKHKEAEGANYFYYVLPLGLVELSEVEKRYGVVYVDETGSLTTARRPQRLNNNIFSKWKEVASKCFWRAQRLLKADYRSKNISYDEYVDGLSFDMEGRELHFNPSP